MFFHLPVKFFLSVGSCVGRFNFCEAGEIFLFFFLGSKSKLFEKALIEALPCAALVMCLLLGLANFIYSCLKF